MKTLNLALIATLTLTSASAIATSTGTNWSTSIGHSTTAIYQEETSNRLGSGTITSFQDIFNDAGDVIGQSQLIESLSINTETEKSTEGLINGGYHGISSGYSAGKINVSAGIKTGSSGSSFDSESHSETLVTGSYTDIANYTTEGNTNTSAFTGTIYKRSQTSVESTQQEVKLYGSTYSNVDFEY